MRVVLLVFALFFCPLVLAWNGTGHRLVSLIAWERLDVSTREFVWRTLEAHPDFPRWVDQVGSGSAGLVFAEASVWPDEIRNDPRYYDEHRSAPTDAVPGIYDNAQHRRWHYADMDAGGSIVSGEIGFRIKELGQRLQKSENAEELAWALCWLSHLVADSHQPMHVGDADDAGGNTIEVEDGRGTRHRLTTLHRYWDELPGPSRWRGTRLSREAIALIGKHKPAPMRSVDAWLRESHSLLQQAYPAPRNGAPALIDEDFHVKSEAVAQQRLVDAGVRLAHLLEQTHHARVSRETAGAHSPRVKH